MSLFGIGKYSVPVEPGAAQDWVDAGVWEASGDDLDAWNDSAQDYVSHLDGSWEPLDYYDAEAGDDEVQL